jgi:hypothetical protein
MRGDLETKQYSTISGVTLAFAIVSPILSWFAFQTNIEVIQAIGVLVVPFALFCWIFTTIRALHKRAVRFWFIPSTYVAFFIPKYATATAGDFAPGTPPEVMIAKPGNYVMMFVAAMVQAGTTMWCLWFNRKKTESLVLAFSLTALQTLLSSLLVAFFWLRFGGTGDRDHVDAVTGQVNVRERM